jgi:hypothetical protein
MSHQEITALEAEPQKIGLMSSSISWAMQHQEITAIEGEQQQIGLMSSKL